MIPKNHKRFTGQVPRFVALFSAALLVPGVLLPAVAAGGATNEIDVELVDIGSKPKNVSVASGTDVVLKVKNTGAILHNLQVNGGKKGTGDMKAGAAKSIKLGKVTKTVKLWCTIVGHKEAGMTFDVKVGRDRATEEDTSTRVGAAGDLKLDPSATWPKGFKSDDPNLKPADAATTHDVTFHMTNKIIEVAPGVKQEMWTFGDQVPGPTLHGKVGDTFNVTIVNDTKMTHNIDFHASQTSMDVDMGPVEPGESLTYTFKAEYSGIWMYHCGTAPALHHIGNGMAGAVVIDPPNLAPVDHEWTMVQSDLYFGAKNKPGSLSKMQAFQPDAIVFNGKARQYADSPLKVKVGDRIRIWVLDVGPSENSAFHVVGTIFDTAFKEGAYVLRKGNAEQGGMQALDLQPSQGGFVEFEVRKAGMYAMVTHKFQNVGKGALGVIVAE